VGWDQLIVMWILKKEKERKKEKELTSSSP
jgi:hypothetical protein